MNGPEPSSSCERIASLFVFYLCDEAEASERVAIEQHLEKCQACRRQLEEERAFSESLSTIPQAADILDNSGILLSQCRSELDEKLDDLTTPVVKDETLRFAWFRRWMVIHPAWSGATLVVFGLVIGTQAHTWFAGQEQSGNLEHAVNVRAGSQLTDEQLSKMAVAGINFSPSSNSSMQKVRLQLSAEQPMELSGTLDDSDVRQVLAFVVKSGERFNSGLRLDCLDALKSRSGDAEVRGALLQAARKDPNPAVRLKALEALRDSSADPAVRETLLDSLQHDANPGVRVEAVNLLVRSLEEANIPKRSPPGDDPAATIPLGSTAVASEGGAQDESMSNLVQTLEHLQQKDPSRYVRLQSAAALHQIDVRRDH